MPCPLQSKGLAIESFGYVLSAIIGVALIVGRHVYYNETPGPQGRGEVMADDGSRAEFRCHAANFLDKTLLSVAHVAEQSLFSEAYARKRGLLQSLDVRIKLVSFLCIIVLISFLHAPQTLWIAYGLSLLLAAFSGIPLWFFLKRVWLFVPLFSAAIVLPALLNIITPGDPLLGPRETFARLCLGPVHDPRGDRRHASGPVGRDRALSPASPRRFPLPFCLRSRRSGPRYFPAFVPSSYRAYSWSRSA